jgi:hypothetical protein
VSIDIYTPLFPVETSADKFLVATPSEGDTESLVHIELRIPAAHARGLQHLMRNESDAVMPFIQESIEGVADLLVDYVGLALDEQASEIADVPLADATAEAMEVMKMSRAARPLAALRPAPDLSVMEEDPEGWDDEKWDDREPDSANLFDTYIEGCGCLNCTRARAAAQGTPDSPASAPRTTWIDRLVQAVAGYSERKVA